ncbi:MAG: D-glycerate dehydrogenase [Anaerolineales bacterium]|jgi:lactate dehydrogenase-like 2-hydroxyacid dehydrogenase
MSKPRVFVTRRILESGMKLIQDFCEADIWPEELPPTRQALLDHVHGMDGLLCLLTDQIDSKIMDAAGTGLKVISSYSVGIDNVEVAAASARGIAVGNTPGVLTDATADLAFALLLAAGRRISEGERLVKSGGWKTWGPAFMLGADLAGATLGIVGFGRIGRAVARRAVGFGIRIIFSDPSLSDPEPGVIATQVDLDTLLREADFISLHTPLTTETHGLINAATLERMKATAVLVNTSRGPVVDQPALYEALVSRRIFAAALDVTVPEPLPVDDPLLTLDNCLIVPHIASASWRTRAQMSLMAAENLIAGLKGERLPNCANPEVYDK